MANDTPPHKHEHDSPAWSRPIRVGIERDDGTVEQFTIRRPSILYQGPAFSTGVLYDALQADGWDLSELESRLAEWGESEPAVECLSLAHSSRVYQLSVQLGDRSQEARCGVVASIHPMLRRIGLTNCSVYIFDDRYRDAPEVVGDDCHIAYRRAS